MQGTNEKISRLQEQMEMLVVSLTKCNHQRRMSDDHVDGGDMDYKENFDPGSATKGVFRNPVHAAFERHRTRERTVETGEVKVLTDHSNLKHLKLNFPTFKGGGEPLDWLRDCEEYFSIYEVQDGRRAAIAAMHMTGVPRSW